MTSIVRRYKHPAKTRKDPTQVARGNKEDDGPKLETISAVPLVALLIDAAPWGQVTSIVPR